MNKDEGIKNFKNFCFWYSEANPDYNHPEIRCKYGINCKYHHLKGNEVNMIKEKGNERIDCFYCFSRNIFYLESMDGKESLFPCPYNCRNKKRRLIEILIQKSRARENFGYEI